MRGALSWVRWTIPHVLALAAVVVSSRDGPSAPLLVDATLTARLSAGKSTYAMGEIIPLELEFRGQAGADYYFSTASGDRPVPVGGERYAITPAGGHDDPLSEYFSSVGVVGSVLSGWHPLDGTPFLLRVRLNEWVRFTRPGDYRLVVTSTRLGRYSRRPAPPVVSEPVALCIVPATPEWAAAQAARAAAQIEAGEEQALRDGVAILRHLGTRDAALSLVSHYGAGGDAQRFHVTAGLVASPYRADIVKAMDARIDGGETLPAGFARDLALLRALLEGGTAADRFERQRGLECEYARRWIDALARRGPSAESLGSALAALTEAPDPTCETGLDALLAGHPAAAREAFLALPGTTQHLLLEHRWEAVDGPWVQPALEALYESWAGDWRFAGAGDLALRRIVEKDPEKGRSLALEEMRTGAHGLAPDTLTSVVEEPLAGLDDALRERCRAADSPEQEAAAMWLVAQLGSADLAPLVRAELERDSACELEAAAIAYLLKHDSRTALGRLHPGFDRSRRRTCVAPPWAQLAPRLWDDRVEDAAVAHLRGGGPRLALDAAQALGAHGSPRVKAPLLERLARWSAEWTPRAGELEQLAAAGPPSLDSPALLENALVNALFDNPQIGLTAGDVERIRRLCATTSCREDVAARARARSPRLQ